MIVFEHRIYADYVMTDTIVSVYYGEHNRILAYATCPHNCVVWEHQV